MRAAQQGEPDVSLVAHTLHYRYRGWNGRAAHPAQDAEWAVAEVVRRYGDVPVCLAGVDVGARAALRAAGHPMVDSVLAVSPWLPGTEDDAGDDAGDDARDDAGDGARPDAHGGAGAADDGRGGKAEGAGRMSGDGTGGAAPTGPGAEPSGSRQGAGRRAKQAACESEPVRQLIGRHVLLVHGSDDEHTAPELSYRLAERAKKSNANVCRFEVHTDGHRLRHHQAEVAALAENFILGTLCGRELARPLTDALAAPPPLGLRMPLATGFGRSLRR
ncbi:alpha/beta hydrolase [Streptomyces ovatisporus]|uniref:Alpha/beta hydrolase n=1 Tax=Streptomyces ovatisporus TaxID=1128682 RepID=A0ABV8ZYJ1_9ACTN